MSRGLRGADIHAAVDGHRVERDDFRAKPLGERDTDGRFADGCRAAEEPAVLECMNHSLRRAEIPANERHTIRVACDFARFNLNWSQDIVATETLPGKANTT